MRRLYQECHLIHADLSEYNLLYYRGLVYVIDVSQSVEHDHPHALEFLRTDCVNVNAFFNRRGAQTLRLRDLFEYVTAKSLAATDQTSTVFDEDAYLKDLQQRAIIGDQSLHTTATEEAVFQRSFIPRNLNEVVNLEKEIRLVNDGGAKDLVYRSIAGVVGSASVPPNGRHSDDSEKTLKANMLSRVLGVNLQSNSQEDRLQDSVAAIHNDEEDYISSSDEDELLSMSDDSELDGSSASEEDELAGGGVAIDPEEFRKAKKVFSLFSADSRYQSKTIRSINKQSKRPKDLKDKRKCQNP